MQATVLNLRGKEVKKIKLPAIFSCAFRQDLIKRAFLAIMSAKRQPYGSNLLAGKRTSAHYHGRRGQRFGMMNRELARMARLHGTSPHLHFRASLVPQAVGGRRAHPPKAEKIWEKKINKKERRLAIASAIAGTANPDVVASRGHIVAGLKLPLVIVDDVQKISKTAELASFFERIGLLAEMQRVSKKKIRAGKGKMRGRKYKRKVGPLIVITEDKGIVKATSNLPGFDTILVKNLNVEALSPGAHGARLTLYTESAIKELEKYPVM